MIVAAREFTSAAEMRAHSVAVRQRCFNPKAKPIPKTEAVKLIAPTPYKPPVPVVIPSWQLVPTMFEEHIFAYRAALKIREMVEAGEIEIVNVERRTVQQIVLEVLKDFPTFTIQDLKSARRTRALCHARMLAVYEVRVQRPDLSYPAIGRWFGGKDHTSIIHSYKKIKQLKEDTQDKIC